MVDQRSTSHRFNTAKSQHKMEDTTARMAGLTVRESNIPFPRNSSLKQKNDATEKKNKGFLTSVKRLFSISDSQPYAGDALTEKKNVLETIACRRKTSPEPSRTFFTSQPSCPLPEIEGGGAEFAPDICEYLYSFQCNVPVDFLAKCSLSDKQRSRIVAFMARRHSEYPQPLESFHLSIWLMDSLLQNGMVNNSNAEVHSIAALNIATRFERQTGLHSCILKEHPIRVLDRAERQILACVHFELGRTTIAHAMRVLAASALPLAMECDIEANAWAIAKVLSQLAVTESRLVAGVPPSLTAAAVLRCSLHIFELEWTDLLTAQSQCSKHDIDDAAWILMEVTRKAVDKDKTTAPILFEMKPNMPAGTKIVERAKRLVALL